MWQVQCYATRSASTAKSRLCVGWNRQPAIASGNSVSRRNVEWVCCARSPMLARWMCCGGGIWICMFNSEATICVGNVVASFSALPRNNWLQQIVIGSFDLPNWFVVCHFMFYAIPLFFFSVLFSAFVLAAPFHLMAFFICIITARIVFVISSMLSTFASFICLFVAVTINVSFDILLCGNSNNIVCEYVGAALMREIACGKWFAMSRGIYLRSTCCTYIAHT